MKTQEKEKKKSHEKVLEISFAEDTQDLYGTEVFESFSQEK